MDRRGKAWRELTSGTVGADESDASSEIVDGIVFVYESEPRCRVCGPAGTKAPPNSEEVRTTVDRMLVTGATYKRILLAIEPLVEEWDEDRRPGYHSIRRHQIRHLPADAAAVREVVERRALDQGLRIAVGDGPIVTRAALLEIVRDRGLEALAAGDLSPTLAETLHAAEVLEEIDREAGSFISAGELAGQIRDFVEIVKAHVPVETWNQIVLVRRRRSLVG